jgi:hypothetical protein
MRMTVTLDDDLALQLQEMARRTGVSFKEIVNVTLWQGLSGVETPAVQAPGFTVQPKACGFRSGIDPLRLNRLYDELETEDF